MLTQQRLIGTTLLIEWAGSMSAQYRDRVERLIPAEDLISLEKETHIKSFLATLISEDELKLLMTLLNDSNGKRWEPPVDGCPSKILINLGLARYDCGRGERLLKATKFAFLPQIQYLIGLTRSY